MLTNGSVVLTFTKPNLPENTVVSFCQILCFQYLSGETMRGEDEEQ